jgi:hypothetical protein
LSIFAFDFILTVFAIASHRPCVHASLKRIVVTGDNGSQFGRAQADANWLDVYHPKHY